MHVSINEIEFCVLKLQHKKDVHNKFHENSLSSSCLSKHLIKNVYSALDGFFLSVSIFLPSLSIV